MTFTPSKKNINEPENNHLSNIKFAGQTYLSNMATKINRQVVIESPIPLNILYNDTVNKVKREEKDLYRSPKALTFTIKENPKNK